jgi:hypothetical protein
MGNMMDRPVPWEEPIRFNGADYKPERDNPRLITQLERVYSAVSDSRWHTLEELETITGDPTPSISAQLRHLRKKRFGAHIIERRHVGNGLYEYRLVA